MLRLPLRRLATAAVGVVVLVGCTDTPTATDDVITLEESVPAPGAPDDEDEAPAPAPDEALDACAADEQRTLVAAVDGQLAAIADRAWDDALSFATPGFRQGIDADDFAGIITDSFPVVAAHEARDIGACLVADDGDEATLVVTVEDGDGTRQPLLYLFERGDEGWGIGGALPGRDVGDDSEPALTA